MMKLPGHVPQDIVFVWSCSEFLSMTRLTMLCLKFTCWGRWTDKFLVFIIPITNTYTLARTHAHAGMHTPHTHIFSPFQMFSWLALPDHQVSGIELVAHQWWSTEVPPWHSTSLMQKPVLDATEDQNPFRRL